MSNYKRQFSLFSLKKAHRLGQKQIHFTLKVYNAFKTNIYSNNNANDGVRTDTWNYTVIKF